MVLGLYDALDESEGQTLDQLSGNLKIEYYPLEILLKSLEYAQVIIKIGDKYFNSPTPSQGEQSAGEKPAIAG